MKAAAGPTMSRSRYAELKQMLDERRREIQAEVQGKMRGVREEGTWGGKLNEVLDAVESSEADIQEELEFALIQMKSETLNKINDAMLRLEQGDYGNCFECGEEIAEKRLRALPFAVRCKDCEEAREIAEQRERQAPRGAAVPRSSSTCNPHRRSRTRVAPVAEPNPHPPPCRKSPVRDEPQARSAIHNKEVAMSDQIENLKPEDVSIGDRPLSIPSELPILPLRDTVLFPNSFMPLAVARESSVRLIDDAIANGKLIAVFTQRDASIEEPGQDDLYTVGTATHIHKMFKLPDGSLRLIVQGLARLTLEEVVSTHPYLRARVSAASDDTHEHDRLEIDALARNIKTNFQQVVSLSPLLSDDLQTLAINITEPGRLADFIASSLSTISTAVKQEVLETLDIRARMDNLNRILIKELEVLELGSKIQSQVQSEVGKNQREYFLREQMKAIQKELGEGDEQTKEIEELNEKIEAAGMPEPVKKEALRELDRLSKMPVAAAEYTVSRTYLDWLVALPWAKRTEEVIDLPKTKSMLDADHSGLEKAKDRILEYLAVRKLNPDVKGPILCFVGPPGVGKTSLARSIAESLGRKFVRVSLGGMRDEAEIRGHRRTYIGALPGQIIQGLRRAESKNPVFILDEIDKLGSDFRGDPSSALLEVLDPEQNNTFRDHYLDVPFDLSRGAVHHDGERARSGSAGAARPHGSARDRRLHGRREAEDRRRSPGRQTGEEPRPDAGVHPVHRPGAASGDPRIHPRSRRPQPGTRNRCRSAARSRAGAPKATRSRSRSRRKWSSRCSAHRGSSTRRWKNGPKSRASPSAWRGRRPAAKCSSSKRRVWREPVR